MERKDTKVVKNRQTYHRWKKSNPDTVNDQYKDRGCKSTLHRLTVVWQRQAVISSAVQFRQWKQQKHYRD